MKLILQSVRVVDSQSSFHLKVVDIYIQDKEIKQIGKGIKQPNTKVIDCKGMSVSPGWVDLNVNFCDPGFETKEDIETGLNAASLGGFVAVALMPNTFPALKSKSEIEYIKNKGKNNIVDILPIGSLSARREGTDLAEMFDMQCSGAVAFSDGNRPVQDSGLMSRALLYAKGIHSLIINQADDKSISLKAKVNEGEMSTLLGMKGSPSLAEELHVSRDIFLAEYQQAKVHFTCISTSKSVELIKAAKKKGIAVTADVCANNLFFDETLLEDFDSNYKTYPPLRTKNDIKSLINGLKDGSIDAICSQHTPEEIENKQVEFEHAAYGMIGLQTAFSLAWMSLEKQLSITEVINKFTIAPRLILGLPDVKIEPNQPACLTLFNETEKWVFKLSDIVSKSKNSPIIGSTLKGKVKGIINNAQIKIIK